MNNYQTHEQLLEQVYSDILFSWEMTDLNLNLLSLSLQIGSLNEENKRFMRRLAYAIRRNWLTFINISEKQIDILLAKIERALIA